MTHVALLQLNVSDDPSANLKVTLEQLTKAADAGATFLLTPEVTNCISSSRKHQMAVLQTQDHDITLAAIRSFAKTRKVWVLIGSLALKTDDLDDRFANRSFLIDDQGDIVAHYDKIHMFDVTLSETESYRESAGYRPGNTAVVAKTALGNIGLSICYDVRFPHLYRDLAKAGAQILTIPAAFARPTGQAHWETLLRARAIETGCYVLAPAQCGEHDAIGTRKTHGHSMIIDPWGEICVSLGSTFDICYHKLDLMRVEKARQRVPSLQHDYKYLGPQNAR